MSDPYLPSKREFRDLVPWADPYITSLLAKLQRAAMLEAGRLDNGLVDELPPPLDKNDREDRWRPDWTEREWPRG